MAACDAAKMAIYVRSLLDQIGIPQEDATLLLEDNTGALMMENAGQSTKRTRHMDIRHFAIQDWVEEDIIILEYIDTSDNSADSFTKPLGRTLFNKHCDVIMGRTPPQYYTGQIKPTYRNIETPKVSQLSCYEGYEQ